MPAAVQDASKASDPELPLTGPQLGIWNAQQFDPESGRYLVGEVLEISGDDPIDVEALAEAIGATVAEAENMRLRFRDTAAGPRQTVCAEPAVLQPMIDLRGAADPVSLAHEAVALERHQAAQRCRGMVDRRLYNYTLIRLTECEVWCVQLYHHLIVDGYSAALLSRRVAAHYTALRRGSEPPKATFGAIAELVADEQNYRDSAQFAADQRYWREQLSPAPSLDGRGTALGGAVERTIRAEAILPVETLDRLRSCTEKYRITWADGLIACYAAYVQRLLGNSDVVLSMLMMGRVGRVALSTPAMAVNVLPLRLTVHAHDTVGELGVRVAETLRDMRKHQRYSGADLARDLSGFGAGELLHGVGMNLKVFDFALDFDGAEGVLRNVAGGPPEDLGLVVTPLPDKSVLLGFECDARTNDPDTAYRRVAGLVRVVEAFTELDKVAVGALELVEHDERVRLLAGRAGPAAAGGAELVPAALDRMIAEYTDDTVLVAGSRRYTGGELGGEVRRLVRYLRDQGVRTGDLVGVALPRTADLVVALLAVWRAGGTYLPLDPEHPVPRLRTMIEDAAPVLVVTDSALSAGLACRTVVLDAEPVRAALRAHPDEPVTEAETGPIRGDHPAYVLYTSGSTGTPKGVVIDHTALAQLVAGHRSGIYAETVEGAGGRRLAVAHTTSFAFDAALDPLLWLLDGHRIHLYDSEIRRDPAALVAAFGADGVEVVDGTPTLAAALFGHGLTELAPRLLVLGGEACPPDLWQAVQRAGITAVNLYGPTEATVDAIGAPVRGADPHIGFPLPGVRAYLLDNGLQTVADGQAGELYLAGAGIAQGYLGRPGFSAQAFVADPFGPPGARMYRTGDLARWAPGRGYFYSGRADAQVKIRGHRIEIGEVEAALSGLPEVAAAAADVRDLAGRPSLIGYVVPAARGAAETADLGTRLRNRLAESVPDPMVPTRIVVLGELPWTVNGKVDRAALPEPAESTGGRAPATPAEQAVGEVVAELLGRDTVDIDDDFFGAGGDSITAIGVCSRLRERGVILAPQDLLTRRSLGELAAAAEPAETAAGPVSDPAPRADTVSITLPPRNAAELAAAHGPIADVLPLSPLQEGLLFHALRDGAADVYTLTARFELAGPVDPERLAAAFATVLTRHPNLGAAFHYEQVDQPVQVIPRAPRVAWRVADLRSLAAAAAEEGALALETEAGAQLFDIAEPPLLRALLIRLSDTTHRLVLTAHHLLADGWSVPIVLREMLALYHGEQLSEPGYYGAYLAWLAGRDSAAAARRWGEYLAGLQAPSLVGAPGPRSGSIGLGVPLAEASAAALEVFGRANRLTMNTLLQGAWALVLAEQLGRTDIVFGAVVSGRPADLPGVAGMVGLFSNTVPVRLDLDPGRAAVEQFAELQQTTLELQNQGYLGLATVERAAGVGRLFDTLVVYENFPKTGVQGQESHEVAVADVTVHSLTHYPVTVTALPGDRFRLMLHHDPGAVDRATAQRLAGRLAAVLTALVDDPGATAGAVLDATRHPDTRGRTLADWGSVTPIDPESPAVTAEGVTIGFGEFEARANRLARWLVSQGVGPETVVTVAMPRSPDSVIAAHAICRAGGVYLPVDPGQPAERVDTILATAAAPLVLTTGAAAFETDRAPVVSIDTLDLAEFAATALTDDDRRAPLRPENAAYLLFTSGSTGVPKGVTVAHEAIVNTFAWLQEQHRFGSGDTVLYRTPATFDASLLEIFLPLLVGARIVLARPNGHRDPYYQAQLMAEERVSAVQMTSSMLTTTAEESDLSGCTALRCVFTGGEPLPPGTAQRFRAVTGARVNNLYGPTEAAVCITYHATTDADTVTVPIGRPPGGAGVRVLDDQLLPVPFGVVGELYLTGVQLARGYIHRPEQTARTFVADPAGNGERMYRTGDLVRWGADGELEYVGRTDSQVKLRGQRIELGDIESAVLRHPGVAQVAVILREDIPGDQRLAAYLRTSPGACVDPDAVRATVREVLPEYMIPAAFVELDEIPMTSSEKLDRKALPVPDYPVDPPAVAAVATAVVDSGPPGVTGAVIEAMAAVLGVAAIGVDDDFFAAGGHSLTAVRLVGRLRRAGHDVVVDDIFEAPTARTLAARIDGIATPSEETAPTAAESPDAEAPSEEIAMLGRRLDHVLELRTRGSAEPLFCVHPVGGTAWQFTPLARRLRADRPLVGLQLPALRGTESGATTIDELAARYLATIRERQPEGPYHLLGYSLGGNIVHAIAAALAENGEEVAFVGLVDSHPLADLADQAAEALADPDRLEVLLPELPADAPDLAARIRGAAGELLRMVTVSAAPGYSGPMALYAADPGGEDDAARVAAQLSGWRRDGARITPRRLPYTHFGIVSEDGWSEVAALLDTEPALRT